VAVHSHRCVALSQTAEHATFPTKHCSAGSTEAQLVSEPLQLSRRRLVLFAVNDNPFVDVPGGGTHWTLLVYSSTGRMFWHFDSAGESGGAHSPAAAAAGRIAQAVGPFLQGCGASLTNEYATDSYMVQPRGVVPY